MPKNDSKSETTADERSNARLEHSQGGITTRDDATDVGVSMLPGDPSEPVGPEDALGVGSKRGDYRDRLGGVQSYQAVAVTDAKPGEPTMRMEAQTPRAGDIGDVAGRKGGVTTS